MKRRSKAYVDYKTTFAKNWMECKDYTKGVWAAFTVMPVVKLVNDEGWTQFFFTSVDPAPIFGRDKIDKSTQES